MGAYKMGIDGPPRCQNCTRRATWTVYNTLNQLQGKFCSKHADERVKSLNRPEVIRAQTQAGR